MSGEPTALELADRLIDNADLPISRGWVRLLMRDAAAELRRQHAVIEALAAIPDEVEGWAAPFINVPQPRYWREVTNEMKRRVAAVIESGGAS